jgi:hypothetical protein
MKKPMSGISLERDKQMGFRVQRVIRGRKVLCWRSLLWGLHKDSRKNGLSLSK